MANMYDPAWVAKKTREVVAAREAERLFPLPKRVDPMNPHDVVEVDKTFQERKRYVDSALKQ